MMIRSSKKRGAKATLYTGWRWCRVSWSRRRRRPRRVRRRRLGRAGCLHDPRVDEALDLANERVVYWSGDGFQAGFT